MTGLRTVSLVEALAASLRTLVLDGELAAGATLTETDVAERFQVSRPTAKTAISLLVQAGLLRRQAHRTAYVPQLSAADVRDLFLVRIPLELAVVERIAGLDRPRLDGASLAVRDMSDLAADSAHGTFVEADLGFHQQLVDALGSSRLSTLYATLTGEIHLSMVQSHFALGRQRIIDEHGAVLDALAAGDPARAVNTMRAHLTGARDSLAAHLDGVRPVDSGPDQEPTSGSPGR